jgi:hypothetical protein
MMKRTKKLPSLALVGLVLALSACGGSSSYRNDVVVVKDPEPVKMIDAFTKFVMNLLGSAPDNQESVAVNDVALTSPDNTEPELVN